MRKSNGYPNRLKPRPSAREAVEGRVRKAIKLLLLLLVTAGLCVLLFRGACQKGTGSGTARLGDLKLERESGEPDHDRQTRPRKNIKKKMKPADEEKPAGPEVIKGPVDLGSKIEMITEPVDKKRP